MNSYIFRGRALLKMVMKNKLLFWYCLGIVAIGIQGLAMIILGIYTGYQWLAHGRQNSSSYIAVMVLFIIFGVFFWAMGAQALLVRSETLGGLICAELLLIPVDYTLCQSHQIILAGLLTVSIMGVIPVIGLRKYYCRYA